MSTEKSSGTNKITYPIYEMETKGRLILPEGIINQIMFLHATIGKTEWSGILLYDVVNGNPSKPADFVLEAKHIFLMDIGSAAFTEYETDGDIVDLYDKIDGAMQMKIGHVHSHHDMSAFFSGTDTDELMQNVDKHNYYLSLIVNFSGNYVAKVAFLSERKVISWMHYTDDHGELKKFKEEITQKTMIVVNLMIQISYNNEFFYNRIIEVKEKKKAEEKAKKNAEKLNAKKGKVNSTQQSFQGFDDDFQKMYKQTNFVRPVANDMSSADVEALTKNMLAVTPDLSETRSVYQVLNVVAEATDEEAKFYYEFFEDNIEAVLLSFFQTQRMSKEDVNAALAEVIMSIQRFKFHKRLETIIPIIVKRINHFYGEYEIGLDNELEEINKMVESYGKD